MHYSFFKLLPFLLILISLNSFSQSDDTFVIVDEMPEFIHGNDSLDFYMLRSIQYPKLATALSLRGKVHVSFIVNKKGNVSKAKVLKGIIGGDLNKEALAVINKLKFKPGKQSGTIVNVQMTQIVTFPFQKNVYKGDNKKITYDKFPNLDDGGGFNFYEDQYYLWIYNKGIAALQKNQWQKALNYFNEAIEIIGTRDAHPYFQRGIAKLELGNHGGACGDFRRAKKLWLHGIEKTIKKVCGK